MTRKNRKHIKEITKSFEQLQTKRKGTTHLTTLLMIFVVLKLTNNIGWSWLWVLSPIWLPVSLVVVIASLVGVVLAVLGKLK